MRNWMVKKLLKCIDYVLGVKQENPVYIVLCGEGCVEIQRSGEDVIKLRL